MAIAEDNRRSPSDPNPLCPNPFHETPGGEDRARIWQDAVRHAGTGEARLRFPAYQHLFYLNLHAQRLVDLLEELSVKFSINTESLAQHQAMIHTVRASASMAVMSAMAAVEETEEWIHSSRQRAEEERQRDPDDVYVAVRERERERLGQKLPPLITFLDEASGSITGARTGKGAASATRRSGCAPAAGLRAPASGEQG